jgi:hypothetical protein
MKYTVELNITGETVVEVEVLAFDMENAKANAITLAVKLGYRVCGIGRVYQMIELETA